MPRPFKSRCVGHIPGVTIFKPAGVRARDLTRVEIHFDELEAIRLVDGRNLDYEAAARMMNISAPTVGRILKRARRKVADALVQGRALCIEEGSAPVIHTQNGSSNRDRTSDETT